MNIDLKNVSTIDFNSLNIDKVLFNNIDVWSAGYWITRVGLLPLTLTNSLGKPLKDYKFYGNRERNNILDDADINYASPHLFIAANSLSTYSAVGTDEERTIYIPCGANTTYTLTRTVSSTMRVCTTTAVPSNKLAIANRTEVSGTDGITVTTSATAQYLVIQLYIDGDYNNGVRTAQFVGDLKIQDTPCPETESKTDFVGNWGKNYMNFAKITGDNLIRNSDGSISTTSYPAWSNETLQELRPELRIGDKVYLRTNTDGVKNIRLREISQTWANTTSLVITPAILSSHIGIYSKSGSAKATMQSIEIADFYLAPATPGTTSYGYTIPVKVGDTTTNIWLEEPLRAIANADGVQSDYIDFANKKVVRKIAKTTITSDTTMSIYNYSSKAGVQFPGLLPQDYLRPYYAICNREDTFWTATSKGHFMWIGGTSGTGNKVLYWVWILNYLGMTTIDEFKSWLDTHPVELYTILDTPLEQAIELPEILTTKGTCTISVETELQPSNASVTYKSSKKEV